jgi:hypothetical protein
MYLFFLMWRTDLWEASRVSKSLGREKEDDVSERRSLVQGLESG